MSQTAAVIAGYPDAIQTRLCAVRQMIYEEGEAQSVGPLTESLKWGEPAYLTTGAGTTIRLAWKEKLPDQLQLLVHCNTSLVDQWRSRFPNLTFDGNRALHLEPEPLPEPELRLMVSMALTYHI